MKLEEISKTNMHEYNLNMQSYLLSCVFPYLHKTYKYAKLWVIDKEHILFTSLDMVGDPINSMHTVDVYRIKRIDIESIGKISVYNGEWFDDEIEALEYLKNNVLSFIDITKDIVITKNLIQLI